MIGFLIFIGALIDFLIVMFRVQVRLTGMKAYILLQTDLERSSE